MWRMLSAAVLPERPGAFRLWLALIVVLHHLVGYEFGKVAVLVFFALSGFWTYRVWQSRYTLTRLPIITFIVSRWWRIAPMLIFVNLLSAALLSAYNPSALDQVFAHPARLIASSIFGLGYGSLPNRLVGAAWSIDIEMQFYILLPVLAFVTKRYASRAAALASVGLMAGAFLLDLPGWWGTMLPFFFLGMCASQHQWKASRRSAVIGASSATLLVMLAILSPWHSSLIDPGASGANAFGHFIALLLLPAALASVSSTCPQPAKACRRDTAAGDLSYIVYLMHGPLLLVARDGPWGGGVQFAVAAVLMLALLPICAWVAWHWVDRPLNRLRHEWVSSRHQAQLQSTRLFSSNKQSAAAGRPVQLSCPTTTAVS